MFRFVADASLSHLALVLDLPEDENLLAPLVTARAEEVVNDSVGIPPLSLAPANQTALGAL